MRKLIISIITIFLVLILGIVFAVPYFLGVLVQKNYPELITGFAQNPAVKLKLIKYHRGWFSSQADIAVKLYTQIPNPHNPLDLHPQLITAFTVNQTIHHGPIVYIMLVNGKYKLLLGRAVVENHINNSAIKINSLTLWTFNNYIKTTVRAPESQIDTDQQRYSVKGLKAAVNYAVNSKQLTMNVNLQGLQGWVKKTQNQVTEVNKALEVQGLQLVSNTQQHENGLLYGDTTVAINKLLLFPDQHNLTTITNLWLYISQATAENDKTNVLLTSTINSIVNQQTNLQELVLKLSLTGLDNTALKGLNLAVENNKSVYPALFNLLTSGFNFNLDQFNFKTDDGIVALQTQLQLPAQAESSANPFFWLKAYKKLTVKGQLQVPQPWLSHLLGHYYQQKAQSQPQPVEPPVDSQTISKQQIDYWLQNNVIKSKADLYVLNFELNNGHLLLNGEKPKVNEYFIEDKPALLGQ